MQDLWPTSRERSDLRMEHLHIKVRCKLAGTNASKRMT